MNDADRSVVTLSAITPDPNAVHRLAWSQIMIERKAMKSTTRLSTFVSAALMSLGLSGAAKAQQPPPQAPYMTFFVVSAGPGKGADLGGLEGADRQCQTLAQGAGAGSKTWRAYLSAQAADGKPAVNARERIGAGPWQNFKGVVVAQNA